MQRLGTASVLSVAAVVIAISASPASAGTVALAVDPAKCINVTGLCLVTAKQPGTASKQKNGEVRRSKTSTEQVACQTVVASPQPPKSDPVWTGHTSGQILIDPCWQIEQMDVHLFWAPTTKAAKPQVSPATLAHEAIAELQVPRPTFLRSPATTTSTGQPRTWVGLYTWVWTSPKTWRPVSRRAVAGRVWAKVTVTPTSLSFTPGTGVASIACPGRGRPWTQDDGAADPISSGGCGYAYPQVGSDVHASLAIRWSVHWVGSGGSRGDLPVMTTTASDDLAVEQIQVVNR